jgi:hypothetical protein
MCIAQATIPLRKKKTIDLGAMNAQSKRERLRRAHVPSSKSEKNVEKEKRRAMNAVSETWWRDRSHLKEWETSVIERWIKQQLKRCPNLIKTSDKARNTQRYTTINQSGCHASVIQPIGMILHTCRSSKCQLTHTQYERAIAVNSQGQRQSAVGRVQCAMPTRIPKGIIEQQTNYNK